MRLQGGAVVVYCGDDGPTCRFDTCPESTSAGEQVDGERTPGGLLLRAPLFEARVLGSIWMSRECERP